MHHSITLGRIDSLIDALSSHMILEPSVKASTIQKFLFHH